MRRGYEAFGKGDLDAVMAILDENIAYHVSGRSAVSGDYKGHQEVLGFFAKIFELSGGTFRLELHDVLANDEHAAVMSRATAQREGKSLDSLQCHLWHVKDGKATEFWGLAVDPYAADEFWA